MSARLMAPEPGTASARRAAGHAGRRRMPRSAHAIWTPPPGRADPVSILVADAARRIPDLVPLRFGRMRPDALAFLRGAAAVMAADLGAMPHTGLIAQACGDAHLRNFGAFAAADGAARFDLTDFDETLPAPFEWDLKRLATSLMLAARTRGLGSKVGRALARRAVHAYRRQMDTLAALPPIDAWNLRLDVDAALEEISDRGSRKRERERVEDTVAASRDRYQRLLEPGGRSLRKHGGALLRLASLAEQARAAFLAYLARLPEEQRRVLDRYRLTDTAFQVVGVGSVGRFCAVGLWLTDDGDPLLLQLKEAVPSVLAPFAGPSAYAHQGQRVVVGQRIMQAEPDVLLGWADAGGRHYYVRQLKDPRMAGVGEAVEHEALGFYARLCGRVLARAHARGGDPAMLAGYLGESDAMDEALAAFADAYADQMEADHAALLAAIDSGRVEAR